MEVKNSIRAERARLNMTQPDLAMKIGVSVQTIQNWEVDMGSCSIKNLLKLMDVFGCSADYLVGRSNTING